MNKKSNKLPEGIVTVGDLIDALEENFDRDHLILKALIDTTDRTVKETGIGNMWTSYAAPSLEMMREREALMKKTGETLTLELMTEKLGFGNYCHRPLVTRAFKVLICAGVKTVDDLKTVSKADLLKLKPYGKATLNTIIEFAKTYGIEIQA